MALSERDEQDLYALAEERLRQHVLNREDLAPLVSVTTRASLPGAGSTRVTLCVVRGKKEGYVVVRCVWDALADLRRAATQARGDAELEPTIEVRQRPVDLETGRRLKETLSTLAVPLLPLQQRGGLDGHTTEIELDGEQEGCRFWWWGRRAPQPWEALGALASEILAFAEAGGA